jgi:hypothetical protein
VVEGSGFENPLSRDHKPESLRALPMQFRAFVSHADNTRRHSTDLDTTLATVTAR